MADFDDEDDVRCEMAAALGESMSDLSIENDKGLESFGAASPVYRVESGREEYVVVEDDDEAESLALAVVRQDLDDEPEIFSQSFLEGQIDTDKLRRELRYDVDDQTQEEAEELSRDADDFWRTAEGFGMSAPDADEDGDMPDPTDSEIGDLADKMASDRLSDPMQYLEDIYGKADAVAKALEITGFNVDDAAEEAVSTDGWQHFLARYDGNSHETKSGFVYWRDN